MGISVKILWCNNKNDVLNAEWQLKSFVSMDKATEWIRKNQNHILAINY